VNFAPKLLQRTLIVVALLLLLTAISSSGPAHADVVTGGWARCSIAQGDVAARGAGLRDALDRDDALRRTFVATRPSRVYQRPSVSLCGDLNADGRTDARALHYQCCTGSSPAPWLVLRRRGTRWRIAYKRLHDTTWSLKASRADLVTIEPKYDFAHDALCCPTQLRIGTLRWTGRAFKRTFRLEDSDSNDPAIAPAHDDDHLPVVELPADGSYVEDCRPTAEQPCPQPGSG
jgi:hypothetical protein